MAAAAATAAATATDAKAAKPAAAPAAAAYKAWDSAFLSRYDTVLFDCDGVLWAGPKVLDGAVEAVTGLRAAGKRVMFVTNNSSLSRAQYVVKLNEKGFGATKDEVLSSSFAAAQYVAGLPASVFDRTRDMAFVVGDVGIGLEMAEAGVTCIEARTLLGTTHLTHAELAAVEPDARIHAVVVGIDTHFTYTKCAYALMCLNRYAVLKQRAATRAAAAAAAPGDAKLSAAAAAAATAASAPARSVAFVSTNQDSSVPILDVLLPGGGSCVAMLQTASGRAAFNVGKPEPFLMDLAVQRFALDRARTLMVGDRLDTDIAFGRGNGVDTLMVLTGVSTRDDLDASGNAIIPTYLAPSVAALIPPKPQPTATAAMAKSN